MDDIKELIGLIAKENGISISADDPILMLNTINQYLIEKNVKAQKDLLEQYKSEIEEISARWADENITRAENILNAALAANKNAVDNQIMVSMAKATTEIKNVVAAANTEIGKNVNQAKTLSIINMILFFSICAGAIIIYVI